MSSPSFPKWVTEADLICCFRHTPSRADNTLDVFWILMRTSAATEKSLRDMNNTNKQTGKAGWCRVRMCFSVCLCKPVWATELERGWSGWTCSICFGARKHTQNRTQPIPPSHTLAHLSLSLFPLGEMHLLETKLQMTAQPQQSFGGFFLPTFSFNPLSSRYSSLSLSVKCF